MESKRDKRGTAAEHGASKMDGRMERHKMSMRLKGQESWAAARYDQYNTSPDKTHETINICTIAKLGTFDTLETRKMLKDTADDMARRADETAKQIKVKADDAVSDLQKKGDEIKEKLQDLITKQKESKAENTEEHKEESAE